MRFAELLLKRKLELTSLVKQIDLSMMIEALLEMELTYLPLRREIGTFLAKKIEMGRLQEILRKEKDAIDRTLLRYLVAEVESKKAQRGKNPLNKHDLQQIATILLSRLEYYAPHRVSSLVQLLCELNLDSEYSWKEKIFPHFASNYKGYSPKIINNYLWKFKDLGAFYPGSPIWNSFVEIVAPSDQEKVERNPWEDEQESTAIS